MARKHLLADLLNPSEPPELTAVNSTPDSAPPKPSDGAGPALVPSFTGRGAVGAMGRSLARLTSEVEAARAAEDQLKTGLVAIELDPSLVDPSPVPDRLPLGDAAGEAAFVAVIREQGQQTPILVRPHPMAAERYQVAFGHRRLRAAIALGRPVRALVKTLSDAELVVAQGQENNAREDLSFIERASFAAALERLGHGRDVIMSALLVDKTELSRLISVRRTLPDVVVAAIGPAPKAGRRRWMSLAERLVAPDMLALARRLIKQKDFAAGSSDARFLHLFGAIKPPAPVVPDSATEIRSANDGRRLARVERGKTTIGLLIDETANPDFGDYVMNRLPELFEAFSRERAQQDAAQTD